MKECRDLLPSEIECRVGTVKEGKGFSLLLYKTARADMTLLDLTYGPNNWQCRYYQVKNTMICSISIWDDEKKQWIEKCDGGDDDFNAEKVKGECSDAFKRAGFRVLPSTRKLYNSPFIWINESTDNNKYAKYEVQEIGYDETSVNKLVIINTKTKQVVFSYGVSASKPTPSQKEPKKDTLEGKGSVSMKEVSATVKTLEDEMANYVSPLDEKPNSQYESDKKVIRDYYNGLPEQKKEQFSAWLFNVVQETDIEKLNEYKASRVATTLRKASGN